MIALIPSKNRPDATAYKLLEAVGFECYFFVEPQDFGKYPMKNKVNILKNDQGITYARNFMLDWQRKNKIKTALICDDDINQFGHAVDGRSINSKDARPISEVFDFFARSDFALGGFNQRQYAWSEKKKYRVNNGKVEQCFLVNIDKISWKYKEDTKEDRDFLMQCIQNRKSFIYFGHRYYGCPVLGSNAGGLSDLYKEGRDSIWAVKLKNDWGKYAKIIKQYGRNDCSLNYKQFAKDMGLKVI